jgi:hypothetical protein
MKTSSRLLFATALLFSTASAAEWDADSYQKKQYSRVFAACENTDFFSSECWEALEPIVSSSESAAHVLRGCRMIESLVSRIDESGPELALDCYARVLNICASGEPEASIFGCSEPGLSLPKVKATHDALRKEVLKKKVKAKFERTTEKAKKSFLEWLDE